MVRHLLMNILLTIVWVALNGEFTAGNFLFGFILSLVIMWVVSRSAGSDRSYFTKLPKFVSFLFFFLYELIKANIQVAYEVITPKLNMTPGIVKFPLSAETDMEITLLANLISLTPGTLSLDVTEDKKYLYVHSMYIENKETFIADIKNGFERKLLEVMR
ncbi:Na+/H+ antiporter subunit E [Fulvivirgaceae bacterium LMO-SS25]